MTMTIGDLKVTLVKTHHCLKGLETQLAGSYASYMRPMTPDALERMKKNNPVVHSRLLKCLALRDIEKELEAQWLEKTGKEWRIDQ